MVLRDHGQKKNCILSLCLYGYFTYAASRWPCLLALVNAPSKWCGIEVSREGWVVDAAEQSKAKQGQSVGRDNEYSSRMVDHACMRETILSSCQLAAVNVFFDLRQIFISIHLFSQTWCDDREKLLSLLSLSISLLIQLVRVASALATLLHGRSLMKMNCCIFKQLQYSKNQSRFVCSTRFRTRPKRMQFSLVTSQRFMAEY